MFIPVELGKHFYPRCSNVLDKIMEDKTVLPSLGLDTSTKKRRYHDMQNMLQKAFNEDREEFDRSAISSSGRRRPLELGA
jgi:regulatory protein NPR1